jgi:hypothetical protein
MTDLLTHLGPTGQENVAVIVAVIAGLIAVDLVWRNICKLQRRQARIRSKADLDAKLLSQWPVTMTEDECRRMNAERWNGD